MEPAQAVIAMHEARDRMSRAAEIAQRRPEDAQARREAHEANATYREFTTRIVPKALRSMPIPVQRLTVLQGISGRSELEPMTVALNPEKGAADAQYPPDQKRQKEHASAKTAEPFDVHDRQEEQDQQHLADGYLEQGDPNEHEPPI